MKRTVAVWLTLGATLAICTHATAAPQRSSSAAVAPFDLARVPIAPEPANLGKFPYFAPIPGYSMTPPAAAMTDYIPALLRDNREARYDRYEFFDGRRLVPVEGRLSTRFFAGTEAAWVEMKGSYRAIIEKLGGVTVWDGEGKQMSNLHLEFADKRHRADYGPGFERGAVYLLRTPTREIWVEVWQVINDANYFLTVVERPTGATPAVR